MTGAQIVAILQLLVAFNVPQSTVTQVQTILQNQSVTVSQLPATKGLVVASTTVQVPYFHSIGLPPKAPDPIIGYTFDDNEPVHSGTGLYVIDTATGCHKDVVKNINGYAAYRVGWCPN